MRNLAEILATLPAGALHAFAQSFATRTLSARSSPEKVAAAIGIDLDVARHLCAAVRARFEGVDDAAAALAIESAAHSTAHARLTANSVADAVELVLSGPRVGNVPMRDTATVFASLIREAKHEVLITGYVAVKAKQLLQPLAEFLDADDTRRATIVLDFKRGNDTTVTEELALRKAAEFWRQQWPTSRRRPLLCYDPRSLAIESSKRTSMHAKVVVIDRKVLFVTSANLTERAQGENLEMGVVVRCEAHARVAAQYFDLLWTGGALRST